MKTYVYLISTLILLFSCQSEEVIEKPQTISCYINGVFWESLPEKTYIKYEKIKSTIFGEAADGSIIKIEDYSDFIFTNRNFKIEKFSLQGSFQKSQNVELYDVQEAENISSFLEFKSRDEVDTTITGNFKFNVKQIGGDKTISITNGKINKVNYEKLDRNCGRFECKINGNIWEGINDVFGFDKDRNAIIIQSRHFNHEITISLPNDIKKGQYMFSSNDTLKLIDHSYKNETYEIISGKLNVINRDDFDRYIIGNFEYKAKLNSTGNTDEVKGFYICYY